MFTFLIFQCISPSYQPLYCTGGVCGLVLRSSGSDYCPEPCSVFKQCSECLKHSECGWCAKNSGNITGQGICIKGSLESPRDANPLSSNTCEALYYQQRPQERKSLLKNEYEVYIQGNTSVMRNVKPEVKFSWHYNKCPPENECLNGHHTCSPKSEKCFDMEVGFDCKCGEGYESEA